MLGDSLCPMIWLFSCTMISQIKMDTSESEILEELLSQYRPGRHSSRSPCFCQSIESFTVLSNPRPNAGRFSGRGTQHRTAEPPGVRHEFHRSGKEVRQQQWSLAK
jgi:hypothetical protein